MLPSRHFAIHANFVQRLMNMVWLTSTFLWFGCIICQAVGQVDSGLGCAQQGNA
jgi:hypothetical protein